MANDKKEQAVNPLDKRLTALEAKVRRMSDNWKVFVARFVGEQDVEHDDGKLVDREGWHRIKALAIGVGCAVSLLIGTVWGITIVSYPDNDASGTEIFKLEGDGDGTATLTLTGSMTASETVTGTGGSTMNGDITLENDEIIDNGTDADISFIFNDDAVTLGEVNLASSLNGGTEIEDNNLMALVTLRVNDESSNSVDWCSMLSYATDVTANSKDSKIVFNTYAANTGVSPLTLEGSDATFAGDVDIDGDGLTCNGDLLVTPGGAEVHINGGLAVGDTTAVGDNNLKVAGTSLLVGAVTLTADIDIDGGDITCPADLTITPTGNDVFIDGGLNIGATDAAGDNNLNVQGTVGATGTVTFAGTLDLDGDAITSAGDLAITPTGTEVHLNGGLDVGGTSAVGDNNLNVVGTIVGGSSVDAANFTCDADAGLDAQSAGAVDIGAATATSVLLGASDCPTTVQGGLKLKYAAKTANYTTTVNDTVLEFTTASTELTNTLPEASAVLGAVFCVGLHTDGGVDLLVITDGTDTFDGSNDTLTFADAGDSLIVCATSADAYTILSNVGGSLSNP